MHTTKKKDNDLWGARCIFLENGTRGRPRGVEKCICYRFGTFTPSFPQSCMPTSSHSFIPAFVPSFVPPNLYSSTSPFLHSRILSFLHSAIPAVLYSVISPFLHSFSPACTLHSPDSFVPSFRHSIISLFHRHTYSYSPLFLHSLVPSSCSPID